MTQDTIFACDALGDLYRYNEQLLWANKELLARCDMLSTENAALRAALQKIADGRGMIPDKSTIYMNGKVPEVPKIFNKYDMQEIALAALAALAGEG